MRDGVRFLAFASALLLALGAPAYAGGAEKDPKVPVGTDPGGIAVALIGPGLEYRLPQLAGRLARDGEGEIIGYDFIDDDRRPMALPDALQASGYEHAGTAAARIIVKDAPESAIVALRGDGVSPILNGKAIAYAAASPAKIIVIQAATELLQNAQVLVEAAKRFPAHLFVISAGDGGEVLDKSAFANELAKSPNVLVVTAGNDSGQPFDDANTGAEAVSIVTDATALTGAPLDADTFSFKPNTSVAMARIAALAVRLKAREPALDAAGLKAKIVALAQPPAGEKDKKSAHGFIAKPWAISADAR